MQSEGKAANKCSAYVGTLLEKLFERMPRVCKAVIKAPGGYIEESKIYLDLFNTFWLLHDCIRVMSSLLFYNVEIKKNP